MEEVDPNGNVLARYTQGAGVDEQLSELRANTTSYYQADGLGFITLLSSGAGTLANTYTYDSYGKLTASTGTVTNPFEYTAREFDSETGIYEYRARYYDQNLGRFLSEDRIGFNGGMNFYRYARNAPNLFTDPSGDVVINPTNFPQGSVADVILAIQRIHDGLHRNPGCDCFFRSRGRWSLSDLIDDPNIWINYNKNRILVNPPNGYAHGWSSPTRLPNNLWLYPDSVWGGIDDIAWTIVHELAHLNGDFSEAGAEEAARRCIPLFTFSITHGEKQ